MKKHQYAPFIEWAAATFIKERRQSATPSPATLAWLRAYGITAGRVDVFLRHGLGHSATMPNGLVMDILELSNSNEREAVEEDYVIDAMLHTWTALAQVYGRTATPSELEVARLQLMVEAGYALIMADGTKFPGGGRLLRLYWRENALLDLTRIERGPHDLKIIALSVELDKSQRRALPRPDCVAAPQLQPRLEASRQLSGLEPNSTATSVQTYDEDRLPVLPIMGRHWHDPSRNLAYGLYGNWRDRWDNTLP
ncbi:hypothetical protein [Paenarthrobacter sp. NPDC058040]|uniref:hypothetical protein n=1 Tax=unclassified Paenarthrobacter TaxID=2634190 RepID=UPI0036DC27A4